MVLPAKLYGTMTIRPSARTVILLIAIFTSYSLTWNNYILLNLRQNFAFFRQQMQTWDWGNIIAALVAVLGYISDQFFSRKQAQLEKKMDRVEAQSHELLVPLTMQLHRLWHGCIMNFVDLHCEDILIKQNQHSKTLDQCNKTLESWVDKNKNDHEWFQLEVPRNYRNPVSFAWSMEVMYEGTSLRITYPRELPVILHDAIQTCDRNSTLWKSYEAFIRHRYVPTVQRIGEIINEHGHLMEPVPPDRLRELFNSEGNGYGIKWKITPRMWFYSYTLAYVDGWNELISKWDEGNYDEIRPSVDFPVGLIRFNIEMQELVANVEHDLIGASVNYGHQGKR